MSRKKRFLKNKTNQRSALPADNPKQDLGETLGETADVESQPNINLVDEESDNRKESKCRCFEIRGKFYCHKLEQGRWIQSSGIGYPTIEMCEENLEG